MQHSAISLSQSTTHLLFLGRNAGARFARIGAFSRRLTVLFALGCGALFSVSAMGQSTDHDEVLTASERTALLERFEMEADQAIDASSILDSTKQANKMSVDRVRTRLEGMTITHATPAIQTLFNLPPNDQCVTGTSTFANCRDAVIVAAGVLDNLFTISGLNLMVADRPQLSIMELNMLNEVNLAPTGSPTISGTVAQNGVLTVDITGIMDPDGLGTFTYQWQADNADIVGATEATYTLTQQEVDKTITVVVSYTDGLGTVETLSSVPTNPVTNVNDAPVFTSGRIFAVSAAENQTAVTTVMATDADGDDITYAVNGGADRSFFNIDADTGVLTFNDAPDYENPIDDDNDNDYVVRIDVCGGTATLGQIFTCSSQLESQTITITVTNVNEATIGIAAQSRSISEDASTGDNVGDELTTTDNPTTFAITGGNTNGDFAIDDAGQITVAKALDFETTPIYMLTVQITKDDADDQTAMITITVTTIKAQTIPALSQVTLVMNSQINANIDQRVNGIGDSDTVNFGGATLTNGADNSAALPTWLSQHGEDLVAGEVNMKSLLANSSFEMSLSAKQTASGQSSSAIWGRGNYRLIEDSSGVSYDGGVFGFTVGVDTPLGERGLGGVALSWNDSKVDYEEGEYQLGLVSVHPYFGWHEDAAKMWVRLGYGVGSLEVTPNSGAKQDSDVSMQSLAGGGSGRITQTADGATELRGKGEVSIARLEVDDSDVSTATGIDVGQVRLALEATHTRELRGGASLQPSAEIGIRYDSGDGENEGKNTGIALRAGVKRIGGRLTLEGNVHGLFARGDYKEWGVDGMVSMNPGRDGQGLSFTVAPGLGDTTSEVERLWQQDLRHSVPTNANDADDIAPRLRATVGYGLTHRWQPYGEMTLANDNNRYGLGVRWHVKQAHRVGFHLNLLGEHRATDTAATNAILLQGKVEF